MVPVLALADEPGVFREPARIQIKGNPEAARDRAHRFEIAYRNRLAAARIVRHRHHDQRNAISALGRDKALESRDVEIALEIDTKLGVRGFRDRQVDSPRAGVLYIRPSRIEMSIIGYDVSRPAHDTE